MSERLSEGARPASEAHGWPTRAGRGNDVSIIRTLEVICVSLAGAEVTVDLALAPRSPTVGRAVSGVALLAAVAVVGVYLVGWRRPAYGDAVE